MKYLFVMAQEGYRWGGSEPLWSSAAERLAKGGNDVRVSVKDWDKPAPQIEHLRSVGCRIFPRSGDGQIPPFVRRQINRIFPPPPYEREHVRTIGHDADLIVVSQGDNADGLRWMEAARASGRKYAIISQAAVLYWWPEDDRAERVAACYRDAAASYFVSQDTLDLTRRQYGSPTRGGKVVRNPFNVRYDAWPPWPQASEDELLLACVARLHTVHKGQDLLFDVLSLPHWRKRRVRVSLYGAGPFERTLRRMEKELNLQSVRFCGQSNDIEEIWAKHHALVLPSRFEGMPLVVIEAMLCGRPCIVTDVGGNRELVRDNVNGFIAKAPTVELFDEAMNRAWENRGRLREMGETAARDVRQFVSKDPGEELARDLAAVAGDESARKQGLESEDAALKGSATLKS